MTGPLAALSRALRTLVAAIAVLAVVASFGRVLWREVARDEGDAAVELTVMHWSGGGGQEEDQIVREILAGFEASHPGIRVKRINPGDAASFYTKLLTMMAAGEPPDVFYVGAERLPAFASLGLLAPVDPLLERDAETLPADPVVLDDFYAATVEAFRFDGERVGEGPLYGIPKDFTTIGFYYNKDLFAQAGIAEPADDWTWDDFLEKARAIARLPGCTGAEFATWPMMVRLYLWTEGVDVVGDSFEDVRVSDPDVIAALERLAQWRHGEERTLTSGKSGVAEESTILTGKVGMAGPFGRWVVPSYRKIENFEWDFAPMPRGAVHANAVATVAWSVSARTEHPDEAWALVRALVSPAAQAQPARLGLAVPTLRAVAESDAFVDPSLPPSRDRSYLDAAEVARVVPWPANPKFEDLVRTRFNQAVKTGDLSVREAAAQFEEAWRAELDTPLARGDFEPMPWQRVAFVVLLVIAGLLVFGAWRGRRTPLGSLERSEERQGFLLASPLIIGLCVFTAFPVLLSLALSFARWQGVSTLDQAEWVGLANYEQLLRFDPRLRTSLKVTVFYALLAVPGGQAFALVAALLMNARTRVIGVYRAAWYLPSVLAGVGVSVLWRWVFDGDTGLMNSALAPVLSLVGLEPPEWFGADAATFGAPAFAILNLWMVGGSMMIYLAGLKGIPRELYEAAALDGAGALGRFRLVTLPMLSPVIFFNGIMAVIGSFQVFTQALVMTGGEPGDLTRFYVLYLYNQAFDFYEMGYASAMAWVLLVIVLALTLFVMRGSRKFVHYEALRG